MFIEQCQLYRMVKPRISTGLMKIDHDVSQGRNSVTQAERIDFMGQLNNTIITKGFIFKTKSCRIQRQFFLCVSPALRNTLGLVARGCLVETILSGQMNESSAG